MNITNVVETCTRDRSGLIGEGKMTIKNETNVGSGGSRSHVVTITENKCGIMDFI